MPPRDTHTLDLFGDTQWFYPVRSRTEIPRGQSFGGRFKRAVSAALKECPLKREEVAAKMAELMDEPGFSKASLDAVTAESKDDHQINIVRLWALVHVTGALSLIDILAEEFGMIAMRSDEAILAERGFIRQQMEELKRRERHLI